MRKLLSCLFLFLYSGILFANNCDTLLLTDGRIYEIQVRLITDDKVFFFHCDDEKEVERSIHLKFVKEIKKRSEIRNRKSDTEPFEEKKEDNYEYDEWYVKEESGLFNKNQYNIVVTIIVGFFGAINLLVVSTL